MAGGGGGAEMQPSELSTCLDVGAEEKGNWRSLGFLEPKVLQNQHHLLEKQSAEGPV